VTTAFVLSGGASLGAVQVGMLRALLERKIEPDLLVGTSAGALNAAFVAGHGLDPVGVAALADVWNGLRSRSLFPLDPVRALAALAGRSSALCSDRGLRRLLAEHLRFDRLEDAQVPLVVVATDLLTGREVALSSGSAEQAILASCALPAVFPPVPYGDTVLVDGGLANNTAVSEAVRAGAETIYVLPSGYSCALATAPRTPVAAAAHALAILTHQRLVADIALYSDTVDLVVLPPPCPLRVSVVNFGRAPELIRAAYESATEALSVDAGRREHPAVEIAMHTHDRATRAGGRGPRRTQRRADRPMTA
jgi:NTE family protein